MLALKINIEEYISDDQPGFVEASFKDAWNKKFIILDKVSIFTEENLDAKSKYPQSGVIACVKVKEFEDYTGRKVYTISTEKPWGIETVEGICQFDVLPGQLTEI